MTKNTLNLEVGTAVVTIKEGSFYKETIDRETAAQWVIGTARFNKEGRDKYGFKDLKCSNLADVFGRYNSSYKEYAIVGRFDNPAMQAKVIASAAKRQAKQQADEEKAQAKKERDAAEKAWRASEAGMAQTAREEDWTGLTLVVQKPSGDNPERRYARVMFVGPQQDAHDKPVEPNYRYAEMEVRQDTTWGYEGENRDFVTRLQAPEISGASYRGSIARMKQFRRMIEKCEEVAAAWEAETGKILTREAR